MSNTFVFTIIDLGSELSWNPFWWQKEECESQRTLTVRLKEYGDVLGKHSENMQLTKYDQYSQLNLVIAFRILLDVSKYSFVIIVYISLLSAKLLYLHC